MRRNYSIFKSVKRYIKSLFLTASLMLLVIFSDFVYAQSDPIGPGKGSFDGKNIIGQLINWDRTATPELVLRLHGASSLQTFSEITTTGEFKLPLPEIPTGQNYGTIGCGDMSKGLILVATDISLLTTLPGFSSPGKFDKGFSEIGMAVYSDEKFSKNIGKPGGKRAYWLYSEVKRTVEAGECNNTNSFKIERGWNAFTLISGASGGPHTYNPGLDKDLGWYWYAFPEDINQGGSIDPVTEENSEQNETKVSNVKKDWLVGEWNGVQVDVQIEMHLKSSGNVWLESIEGGSKKTMDGKWSLIENEFRLSLEEGEMKFNIEQTSDATFRLYGKDASSDIVFTRK